MYLCQATPFNVKENIKCKCGNKKLRFETDIENLGWHCDSCNAFWGLTQREEKLFMVGYHIGKEKNKNELEQYRNLRELLIKILDYQLRF